MTKRAWRAKMLAMGRVAGSFWMVLIVCASACGAVNQVTDAGGGDDDVDAAASDIDADLSPDAFGCEPNAFIECQGDQALRCDAQGTGTALEDCGASCNAGAERCDECRPFATECINGNQELRTCGEDGLYEAFTERCLGGCTSSNGNARCAVIDALFVEDACLSLTATEDKVVAAAETLDVSVDTSCTKVLDQPVVNGENLPQICIVRYRSLDINVGKVLKVSGSTRAVALVVDGDVSIGGLLDVSADGTTAGPGGTLSAQYGGSGASNSANGGGGGGNFQSGRAGGNLNGDGAAANGGQARFAFSPPGLVGGGRQTTQLFQSSAGGGGGGALTVISCKGSITVLTSGAIDAGGGGGNGGQAIATPTGTNFSSGGGGGAGGYVVLQAADTVSLQGPVWANGGGGGGGGNTASSPGSNGGDAVRSTTQATGGNPVPEGGQGGFGGTTLASPTVGRRFLITGGRSGGGGASAGRVQVITGGTSASLSQTAQNAAFFDSFLTMGFE
jgi:hypothetical protein